MKYKICSIHINVIKYYYVTFTTKGFLPSLPPVATPLDVIINLQKCKVTKALLEGALNLNFLNLTINRPREKFGLKKRFGPIS